MLTSTDVKQKTIDFVETPANVAFFLHVHGTMKGEIIARAMHEVILRRSRCTRLSCYLALEL